ncbi:hypothetical protein [Paenibacillus chondroitinus]
MDFSFFLPVTEVFVRNGAFILDKMDLILESVALLFGTLELFKLLDQIMQIIARIRAVVIAIQIVKHLLLSLGSKFHIRRSIWALLLTSRISFSCPRDYYKQKAKIDTTTPWKDKNKCPASDFIVWLYYD